MPATVLFAYQVFLVPNQKAKVIIDGVEKNNNFLFILILNTIHTGKYQEKLKYF